MLHVTVTIIFILQSPPDKMMASFSEDREMSQFTCPDAQWQRRPVAPVLLTPHSAALSAIYC